MAIVHATEESFAREVLESKQPVLVDFWAAWCGPCRMLAPLLEQAAEQNPDCKVVKVDVDACGNLAMRYGIASIPTLMRFDGGEVTRTSIGLVSAEELQQRAEEAERKL